MPDALFMLGVAESTKQLQSPALVRLEKRMLFSLAFKTICNLAEPIFLAFVTSLLICRHPQGQLAEVRRPLTPELGGQG